MRLQVVVSQHCTSCSQSLALGEVVAAHYRYQGMTVEVIDLDDPTVKRPGAVFAVPTFLLDGQLVCVGNQPEELMRRRINMLLLAEEQRQLVASHG
jgi:predicted DsbA family dithiol-disulfide isomerase